MLHAELIEEAKEAFNLFDKKNDGVIDKEELDLVFGSFAESISKDNLDYIFSRITSDKATYHKDVIDFPEFLSYLLLCLQDKNRIDYKEKFNKLDLDQDGLISLEDLSTAFKSVEEDISVTELEEIFKAADSDKDGFINLDDYIKLMIME